MSESGDVATWSRQTLDKTLADWVHDLYEHHRNGARRLPEGPQHRSAMAEDHIRCLVDRLYGVRSRAVRVAPGPVVVDPAVAARRPSKILKAPPEYDDAGLRFRVTLRDIHQHRDVPHVLGLFCPSDERPDNRATDKRDELPPPHSITSSAGRAAAAKLEGLGQEGTASRKTVRGSWSMPLCYGLCDFLECISRTQHGAVLPMSPNQHHSNGQSGGHAGGDCNGRMARNVEGASVGYHLKSPRHVFFAAGVGGGKQRGLQWQRGHEEKIHAF